MKIDELPFFLQSWVQEVASLTQPDSIHLVDGSEEESNKLFQKMVEQKTFQPLNPEKRPNSYLAWSDPDDVARVEERTFICSKDKIDAGPTNNWKDPATMKGELKKLFSGCMKGRTLYIIPYCMGPIGPYAKYGVEITDSPYVVVSLRIMTRLGPEILKKMEKEPFVQCVHSVGRPLLPGEKDVSWPCNPKDTVISHFPETKEVWSYGSGYGGNALLNKKCFALRIASTIARSEGWLAEHMLIIGVTNPQGEKLYMAASFPSACGKTNLAMLESPLPGWKVECIGDDIAWMYWTKDGELRAVNPEFGFFGVAPGTSEKTNKYAIGSISKNSLFTNVGKTPDNDIWWEGLTDKAPPGTITWRGELYDPASGKPAAHPNGRFTAPVQQCPSLDSRWNDPAGVPISAIFFGGRRQTTVPLVREASSWEQGVFFGSSMTSETTAAAKGVVGQVRHDPFAMLPFCGYNMADYFAHWLSMEKPGRKLPKIYYVNWFLKEDGKFLWPGFGENARVLAWAFQRAQGIAKAKETPIGLIPEETSFMLPSGCVFSKLFPVNKEEWMKEMDELKTYFSKFEDRLPKELLNQLESIKKRL